MFLSSLSRTSRHRLLVYFLIAVGLSVSGCDLLGSGRDRSSRPDIRTKELPSLEAVPFDALGGGTIAFQRMHNLEGDPPRGFYVIDGEHADTHSHLGGTLMHDASLSPDGEKVAFQTLTGSGSFWDVYVVQLDGTELRQLSDFSKNTEGPPTWTPDGSTVVFANTPVGDPTEIYAQPPTSETSARTLLHKIESDTIVIREQRLAVSPDRKIAFRTDSGLALLTSGSKAPTQLYEAPSSPETWIEAPAWSPEGRQLAFLEVTSEEDLIQKTRIRILELSDRSVRTAGTVDAPASFVNVNGARDFSLCWTGNGSTIVFSRPDGTSESRIGSAHVYAVPAAGGDVVQVTSAEGVVDYNVSCP